MPPRRTDPVPTAAQRQMLDLLGERAVDAVTALDDLVRRVEARGPRPLGPAQRRVLVDAYADASEAVGRIQGALSLFEHNAHWPAQTAFENADFLLEQLVPLIRLTLSQD